MNEFEEGLRAQFCVTDSVTKDGVLLASGEAVRRLIQSIGFSVTVLSDGLDFPPDLETTAARIFLDSLDGAQTPDEFGALQIELCTLSKRLSDVAVLSQHPTFSTLDPAGQQLVFVRLQHRFQALMDSIQHIDNGK